MNTFQAYDALQLNPDSSFNEIKYAYRKLALELHPDKNDGESDGTKFKLVTEAYHVLKNSNKSNNSKFKEQAANPDKIRKATHWGARPDDRPPEADWEKYTGQTERTDPFIWKSYVSEFWKNYESRSSARNTCDFETMQENKSHQEISVGVDHSRCIGCCSCETIAPNVFSVDKISKMNPKSNVINPKGATAEKILDAAQTCPTKAIHVEDKEAGRRLYPY